MKIHADRESSSITATNESGRLLAVAQSMQDGTMRRSVRIGPLVDAGFVVLSLFSIDMLESEEVEAASISRL